MIFMQNHWHIMAYSSISYEFVDVLQMTSAFREAPTAESASAPPRPGHIPSKSHPAHLENDLEALHGTHVGFKTLVSVHPQGLYACSRCLMLMA